MSKRVTDLNEALASRARNDDHPREAERPKEAEPAQPRLAQRIVALRPLAKQAVIIEPDPEPETGSETGPGLLKLSDSPRFQGHDAGAAQGYPPSRNALVVYRSRPPGYPAERPDAEPAGSPIADARAQAAFVIGLIIATVIGIALYAQLV